MTAPLARTAAADSKERADRQRGVMLQGGEHTVVQLLFNVQMADRDDFLDWFNTTWRAAEDALHDGDAAPRFQTWSEQEPVTLFGAWLNAFSRTRLVMSS